MVFINILSIVKIISSSIILVGFSIIGIYHSYKPNYRKNDLIEMKRAILNLISEINFLSSVEEAISSLEQNLNPQVKPIFTNFKENLSKNRGENLNDIWKSSIDKSVSSTYFTAEDLEKFYIIGKILGNIDKEFSSDSLAIITDYIDLKVLELDAESSKNMKTYQSMGVLTGLAIIIILV